MIYLYGNLNYKLKISKQIQHPFFVEVAFGRCEGGVAGVLTFQI